MIQERVNPVKECTKTYVGLSKMRGMHIINVATQSTGTYQEDQDKYLYQFISIINMLLPFNKDQLKEWVEKYYDQLKGLNNNLEKLNHNIESLTEQLKK